MKNRVQAELEADSIIEKLLSSGDEGIFSAAKDENGVVDQRKLVRAAFRARSRLIEKIMAEDNDV